ncbi:MAG: hypothetical protein AB7T49_09455 [Oligoflexales bacterium]
MKKVILIFLALSFGGMLGYAQNPNGEDVRPSNETPITEAVPAPTIENQVEIESMQEPASEAKMEKITEKEFESLWKSVKSRRYQVVDSLSIEDIVEPQADYHYAAFSKPNPFLAPNLDQTFDPANLAGTEIPMVNALQNYPLNTLSVKGIWQLPTGERRAIIMTPKKEGVIVQPGDPISAGKVEAIEKDHIVSRQFRMLTDGSRQFEDKELYLGMAPTSTPGKIVVEPGKDPVYQQPSVGDNVIPTVDSPQPASSDTAKVEAPGAVVAPTGVPTPTTSVGQSSVPADAKASATPAVTKPSATDPKTGDQNGIPSINTDYSKTRY